MIWNAVFEKCWLHTICLAGNYSSVSVEKFLLVILLVVTDAVVHSGTIKTLLVENRMFSECQVCVRPSVILMSSVSMCIPLLRTYVYLACVNMTVWNLHWAVFICQHFLCHFSLMIASFCCLLAWWQFQATCLFHGHSSVMKKTVLDFIWADSFLLYLFVSSFWIFLNLFFTDLHDLLLTAKIHWGILCF